MRMRLGVTFLRAWPLFYYILFIYLVRNNSGLERIILYISWYTHTHTYLTYSFKDDAGGREVLGVGQQ